MVLWSEMLFPTTSQQFMHAHALLCSPLLEVTKQQMCVGYMVDTATTCIPPSLTPTCTGEVPWGWSVRLDQ